MATVIITVVYKLYFFMKLEISHQRGLDNFDFLYWHYRDPLLDLLYPDTSEDKVPDLQHN